MRGQKRVAKGVHARLRRAMDARERAYDPRFHRKNSFEADGLSGSASPRALTAHTFELQFSLLITSGNKRADPTTREGWFFTRRSSGSPRSRVPGAAQHEAQRNDAVQTPISGLPEICAHMRASRASPTCVDRSTPWRSRISGAPLRSAPRCTASGTNDGVGLPQHALAGPVPVFSCFSADSDLPSPGLTISNNTHSLVPAAHVCARGFATLLHSPRIEGWAERRETFGCSAEHP